MQNSTTDLAWGKLRRMKGLPGHIVEIVEYLDQEPYYRHLRFIRGKLVAIRWKKGRPAKVCFSDAEQYIVNGHSRRWRRCRAKSFLCNQQGPYPHIKDKDHPLRRNAWWRKREEVISFNALDGNKVAIFLKADQKIRQRPFFFQTIKEARATEAELMRLVRGLFGEPLNKR